MAGSRQSPQERTYLTRRLDLLLLFVENRRCDHAYGGVLEAVGRLVVVL